MKKHLLSGGIVLIQLSLIVIAIKYSGILYYQFGMQDSEEGLLQWSQYLEYYNSSEELANTVKFLSILKNILLTISLIVIAVLFFGFQKFVSTRYKFITIACGIGLYLLEKLYFRFNEGSYSIIIEFIPVQICVIVMVALFIRQGR